MSVPSFFFELSVTGSELGTVSIRAFPRIKPLKSSCEGIGEYQIDNLSRALHTLTVLSEVSRAAGVMDESLAILWF